ncbi:hypothetical protein RG963_08930 [Methanosarcina sp. Z-7115]|uniref:Arylsulfatase n=1 Tax=Methanosarcina baikalica TaxID=3073890 RepID=A0ABU2D238_9EURY|nr:hypothetical protein [Methanosarcina sp. Z-7115]MDR7665892.1 hypothetical protein [Methanosarcina sp. Z-7115]
MLLLSEFNRVSPILDDTGFGQFGCYGSPIQTPNLNGLVAGGLDILYAYD